MVIEITTKRRLDKLERRIETSAIPKRGRVIVCLTKEDEEKANKEPVGMPVIKICLRDARIEPDEI